MPNRRSLVGAIPFAASSVTDHAHPSEELAAVRLGRGELGVVAFERATENAAHEDPEASEYSTGNGKRTFEHEAGES